MTKSKIIEKSSGNVFADLGVKNPEEFLVKADLLSQINKIIKQKRLTQEGIATMLGIDQPKVSALVNGKLSGFSTERLIRFINALGRDVDIIVRLKPRARSVGHIRVLDEERPRRMIG